jgi:signal transduction histidine kinase
MLFLAILWTMQVFFFKNYYQEMKVRETTQIASQIKGMYTTMDRERIRKQITDIYRSNDMYIEIQTKSGIPVYIPNINWGETDSANANPPQSYLPVSIYQSEIKKLKKELEESGGNSIDKRVTDNDLDLATLEYAAYITETDEKEGRILYIFSPLYPMGTTIDILVNQLFYVTIISILLACVVSLYLARKITEPITNITQSAARLGEGEYGIVFEGSAFSEIHSLADTLTYTSLELAKTDTLQKDVIANVSHDLRTPLTMIKSYAEMIRDLSGEDPEKRNAHLEVIMDETDRLNSLVNDILEISRMQSGKQEVSFSQFSLKETIESLLQSYASFVEQEGYKLVFISRGEGVINADEERIKQVLSNLISNAFKYGGKDKLVEVKMFDEGKIVRCEVSDHGIGISRREMRHIWERYYKSSNNYRRGDSTGLGLSIVKEILLFYGADFGVKSEVKKGSTFWFELKKNPAVFIKQTDEASAEASENE